MAPENNNHSTLSLSYNNGFLNISLTNHDLMSECKIIISGLKKNLINCVIILYYKRTGIMANFKADVILKRDRLGLAQTEEYV